jgi:hypothetical protein
MNAEKVYFHFFRESGGSEAMNADGDPTPVNFDITAPDGDRDKCFIRRINLVLIDTLMRPEWFGGSGVGAALANGIRAVVLDKDGNEVLDFLEGETIKANVDWALLAGVDNLIYAPTGAGDDSLSVRWTLTKGLGEPGLTLEPGQIFRVIVQDDLSGLTSFRMFAQGTR